MPDPPTQDGHVYSTVFVPTSTDFSQPHRYGALWVPATPTTQGYYKSYFDGVQTGSTLYWNYNDPAKPFPPPPVYGVTAMSGMDQRHMYLILGTGIDQPMTVQSVSVWQASSANNLVYGSVVSSGAAAVGALPSSNFSNFFSKVWAYFSWLLHIF